MSLADLIDEIARLDAADVPAILTACAARLAAQVVTVTAAVNGDDARNLPAPEIDLLLVEEVAELLRLKPSYIYELVRSKKIAALKSGKYVRIPRAAVVRFIAGKLDTPLDNMLSKKRDRRRTETSPQASRP